MAKGDYLLRNDIVVLRILQSAAGDRPIYFASTTGTYEKFAIQPWMIRQGVAFKLASEDVRPSESLIPLPAQARFQGGRAFPFWVDVERSEALLENHYIYRDLTERRFWPDLSTNGIPLQYYQAYSAMANAYLVLNQIDRSNQAVQRARDFVRVALGPVDFGVPLAPGVEGRPPPADAEPGPALDTAAGP